MVRRPRPLRSTEWTCSSGPALRPACRSLRGLFHGHPGCDHHQCRCAVIGRELSASLTGIQWITDGYTLVFAGLLLTGGALGDRLGNRRVFCAGVVVFTAASVACGLAWSTVSLVAARLVEGLGAALIVPGSLALLRQAYPSPDERSRAFGLWGAVAGTAASAGPLLGGLLVTTVGCAGSSSSTCPSDAPACC
jgi:MFS family permease